MIVLKSSYPEFVANQILTDVQLNQLREHLDEQVRLGRVRLMGVGIVCGLNWSIGPLTRTLVVTEGFGITSDGYLVGIPETTFTHIRPYDDPDKVADAAGDANEGGPVYEPWRNPANADEQIPIKELVDEATMAAEPPADAMPLEATDWDGHVLVLYLEQAPHDLNTCLVTDCDNKGRKIDLTVRALLVRRTDLASVLPPSGTQHRRSRQ